MKRISLELMNVLVKRVNEQFKIVEQLAAVYEEKRKNGENVEIPEYIVEMSKCLGLVSGLSIEVGALTTDFIGEIKASSATIPAYGAAGNDAALDVLKDLFSVPKNKN